MAGRPHVWRLAGNSGKCTKKNELRCKELEKLVTEGERAALAAYKAVCFTNGNKVKQALQHLNPAIQAEMKLASVSNTYLPLCFADGLSTVPL